jgi:hypothetical protein
LTGLSLDCRGVFDGDEDGQPAVGGKELDGGGDGGLHFVDGAEGDAVEFGFQFFGAAAVDFCCEAESADGFAEEGGFFVLGFGEGDLDVVAHEGDGDTWKACSGTEVEKSADGFGEGLGAEDGFQEVAAEDAFFVSDGGEVGFGVPFLEEGQVGGELLRSFGGEGWVAGGFEELVEAVGHIEDCSSRFGWASSLYKTQSTSKEKLQCQG